MSHERPWEERSSKEDGTPKKRGEVRESASGREKNGGLLSGNDREIRAKVGRLAAEIR